MFKNKALVRHALCHRVLHDDIGQLRGASVLIAVDRYLISLI